MADDTAKLVVALEARIRDFENNFDKAAGISKRTYSDISSGSQRMTQEVSANFNLMSMRMIGALAAPTAALAAFKTALEKTLEVGKLAADSRLSPEFLSSLYHGAGKNGVDNSEINSALQAFTNASKKTREEAKEFYTSMELVQKGLGKAFDNAPTQGERLRVISQALASTSNESARSALAMQAFGSDNERLLSVIGAGKEKLDEFSNSARELGVEISQGMVAKAREADVTLNNLANVVGGNLRSALVDLAPVIAGITNALSEMISFIAGALNGMNALKNAKIQKDYIENNKFENVSPTGAIPGGPGMDKFFGALNRAYENATGGTVPKPPSDSENATKKSMIDDAEKIIKASDFLEKSPKANNSPGFTRTANVGGGGGGGSGGGGGRSESDQAEQRVENYTKSLERQTAVLEAQNATFGQSNAVQRAAMEIARAQPDLNRVDAETRARLVDELTKQVAASERAREKQEELNRTMRQVSEINSTLASATSGFFQDLAHGVKPIDAVRNALSKLADKMLDMSINNIFGVGNGNNGGGLLGGLLGGFLKGILGGGGIGSPLNILPSATGNVFARGSVIPFASGGVFGSPTLFPMAGGKTGLLGEAGPEAIMPLKRMPGGKLGIAAQGAGGGNMTYAPVFHFAGDVSQETIAALRNEMMLSERRMQRFTQAGIQQSVAGEPQRMQQRQLRGAV